MNWLQRGVVAAALLVSPVLADAQTVRRPEWKLYGHDRDLTRGDDAKPTFFYYLNSEIARLGDGHLLVVTQDVDAGALKPVDARSKATIRRRAQLRIASGYEPPLAHMIASLEESQELAARNEILASSDLPNASARRLYEIDCNCGVLRLRQRDLGESWQAAPPDTRRGDLLRLACATAGPGSRTRTVSAP
jgi:hypothetical protein